MTVTKTQAEAYSYMNRLVGKGWDFDGSFGWQCFDLVNFYWNYLTGGQLYGLYAKDIPFKNNFNGLATVYENTPKFLPQKGDIVVWNGSYGEGAGHVAIVHSANIETFVSLDQNWWGGGKNKTEVAQYITHTYDFPMYFIRPHFKAKSTVKDKVTSVVKPTTKPKNTKKKIVLVCGHGYNDPGAVGNGTNERDFIRNNIVDNVAKYLRQAGHTVTLYNKKQDMYQDTAYGYKLGNKKDYGLYWVKSSLKPDAVIEFHLDSAKGASGGHVIKNSYSADSIDKGLDKALKDTVGTIRGITTRNDLLNVNVAYDMNINYRLVELGFITSKKDMDYIKKNLQAFTKRIAEGIHGKAIGGTPAGSKKKTTWNWSGRFTANTTIKIRKSPNGTIVDKGSWIKSGQWVDFVSVTKKSGYWWIKFKYPTNAKSGYFYAPVCKITDKHEKIKKEKYWGKIKWK